MHRSMGGCSSAASDFEEPEEEFKIPPGQHWRYSCCTVRAHHQLSILSKKQDCDYCRIVDKVRRLSTAVVYVTWIFVLTDKGTIFEGGALLIVIICTCILDCGIHFTLCCLKRLLVITSTILHFIELLIMSLMPSRGKQRGRPCSRSVPALGPKKTQKQKQWSEESMLGALDAVKCGVSVLRAAGQHGPVCQDRHSDIGFLVE